jgi:alkyl hydroperoxide reductase subunit AhpF
MRKTMANWTAGHASVSRLGPDDAKRTVAHDHAREWLRGTAENATDKPPDETVDAVVIGGGAAGLNGALMLARSRRSVVVIDSGTPRNAPAEGVHGLLGLDGTPPAQLLRTGREEVRRYGGRVVSGEVASAVPAAPSAEGDLRFTVTLTDGSTLHARRLLVATGLRDVLPDIPGLAQHWGHGVVHCPYCHGWEVRDESIGILGVGPASVHHALLFRQLTDDLVYWFVLKGVAAFRHLGGGEATWLRPGPLRCRRRARRGRPRG